jgi:hypothetical protein
LGDPRYQISPIASDDDDHNQGDILATEAKKDGLVEAKYREISSTPLFRRRSILGVSAAASLSLYLCMPYLAPEGADHITWVGCAINDFVDSAHNTFITHHEGLLYPLWVPITFISLLVMMSIAKKLYLMIAHRHAVS